MARHYKLPEEWGALACWLVLPDVGAQKSQALFRWSSGEKKMSYNRCGSRKKKKKMTELARRKRKEITRMTNVEDMGPCGSLGW